MKMEEPKMKTELYNYDIFPKVVKAGEPVEITVRPLGLQSAFPANVELGVYPLQERIYPRDNTPRQRGVYALTPCEDGCLRFTHSFEGEQEYYIVIKTQYKAHCSNHHKA